jgi:hypothetical protein
MTVSETVLVGTRKGLFIVARAGGAWRVVAKSFLGIPISAVLRDPRAGALYAAHAHAQFGARVFRSDDGGTTWNEAGAPAFPADLDAGDAKAPAVSEIWAIEAAGADTPEVLWAGTLPAGLFCSHDRGATWKFNAPLWARPERTEWMGGGRDEPVLHTILVDPRDSRRLTIAISVGGVWQSNDAGASWAARGHGLWAEYMPPERRNDLHIQDVHRVAHCRDAPDVYWLQHHNAIFRSDDGLETCADLVAAEPSRYGFAVVAHPHDPLTAWYAPMVKDEMRIPVDGRVVVTRTRDGGRSFQPLRDGLPQQDAYDLVYRHGLDGDASGERLAMGSTTGSLWLSEDGGDSWVEALAHLPPILVVRWV